MNNNYHPPADLLKNRIILITGASDGIGKAVAKASAQHGATTILLSRSQNKLEKVYDEIENAGYPTPALYPLDLMTAVPENYAELNKNIRREFGRLDGIVHCAGMLGSLTPIEQYNVEQWFNVLHVNLNGPFLITQACLPLLKESEDASIIFTTSATGRKGKAYWGANSVAKFGLEGLSQIIADETEQNTNIRANTIDPGPVRTKMRAKAFPGENSENLPPPETIVSTYLYLLGPDSKGQTAQQLTAQPSTT